MVLGTEVTFMYNPEAKRRGHLLNSNILFILLLARHKLKINSDKGQGFDL